MTQNQEDRTTMFSTVAVYMDKNKALWTPTKAVVDAVTALKAGIATIAAKAGKQTAPTGGAAEEKAQVREDLEDKILEVGDQLAAFAAVTADVGLAAQVDFTRSAVVKLSADDLGTTAKRVSAAAAAHLAALADYGIDQADVTELASLTTAFDGAKSAPRNAIIERAAETATLPEVINGTTDILRDRLDKLMTRYRKTQPVFYAGYQSARVVVTRGGNGGAPPEPPVTPA
ncbi:MAG: hypothetical protein ACOYMN_18370 [Roseimicrobium sp.]